MLAGLSLVLISGGMQPLFPGDVIGELPTDPARIPVIAPPPGLSASMDRPPVPFNHDRHTEALKRTKSQDCAACHLLQQADRRLAMPEVRIFKFPKAALDESDQTAVMYGYHEQCVGCHRKMSQKGKKSGPDIGLCGKCHVREPKVSTASWAWSPIFNYSRHAKHLQAVEKLDPRANWNVAKDVRVVGETTGKRCELCHHTFDTQLNRLVYKKDSENSCVACHKKKDEKNARSMKQVAHAACIGCHMKAADGVRDQLAKQGRTELTEQDKKKFGPLECRGCHGEHKDLKPDDIAKIPRLVRGQKDVIDLSLPVPEDSGAAPGQLVSTGVTAPSRMKAVPFNHKAHESRAQFCNTCHHHSLEKCGNCHTPAGDPKKGAGVSYERAFHRAEARQACTGCHATAKQDSKCAGCHQRPSKQMASSSCAGCHRGPSGGKALEPPILASFQDKDKVPATVRIKALQKDYKAVDLPHMKIVNKLVSMSNGSSLARWFHSGKEQAFCEGCHHKTELLQSASRVPKCSTCHNRAFDPNDLGRPGLTGAYHRQCTGCHETMKQKPAALECVKCHPLKEALQAAAGLILQTPHRK